MNRINRIEKLIAPFRVENGKKFRIKDFPPDNTGSLDSKEEAKELLEQGVGWLAELQGKLYAQDQWSVLLIFQAMDAAGKDSAIKHVMSGVNPQGCQVYSFKAPSVEELDHDYLWRTTCRLPARGKIGIFNRSYYEEVLIVRVHQEFLDAEKLPESLMSKNIWEERYEDIRAFEQHLKRNGTIVNKFFLNVSKKEQKKRFLERLENKEKNWKFSTSDLKEREHWDDYMNAYEEMIRQTSTPDAPWYVIPADHKWFTRVIVAAAVVLTMDKLKLSFPKVSQKKSEELDLIRQKLTL